MGCPSRREAEWFGTDRFDLEPDEIGTSGLAVLLQPVGIYQPRRVVVRVRVDRGE